MDNLNPGIRKTVAWLRDNGFDTCDSGDGKTRDFECDRDHAYVVMRVAPARLIEETDLLVGLLRERGIQLYALGEDRPSIQASYDPVNRSAFIDLMFVSDEMF